MIDPSGKMNGRGVYLCDKSGCWERAITTPILSRALNVQPTSDTIRVLREFAAGLTPEYGDADAGVESKELA